MSKVMSLRLQDDQAARLERTARALGKTPAQAAILLLEEALREREFPCITFRDSAFGRQAFLQGTRLAVWQVATVARGLGGDVQQVAAYFDIPERQAAALLRYAAAYPDEIQAAIEDNEAAEDQLTQWVPTIEIVHP